MYIGEKIKTIRKSKHMSLTDLSSASGIQMATLSRIEHKKMVGTLESHIMIAKALGVDVTELYAEISQSSYPTEVTSPKDNADVFTHSEKSSYEILTKNVLQKKMMPTLIQIEPDGRTNKEENAKGNEKFIYVLDGTIQAIIGSSTHTLPKHHSIYFDSSIPHVFENNGKTKAKVLSIATPVSL